MPEPPHSAAHVSLRTDLTADRTLQAPLEPVYAFALLQCPLSCNNMSIQDWGPAIKQASVLKRAVKAWLNEDRVARGLKEVHSNVSLLPTETATLTGGVYPKDDTAVCI